MRYFSCFFDEIIDDAAAYAAAAFPILPLFIYARHYAAAAILCRHYYFRARKILLCRHFHIFYVLRFIDIIIDDIAFAAAAFLFLFDMMMMIYF